MIPIISHGKSGDNGYTFSDFESNFLHICESHRKENRALAFAFILYDFTQPQIKKTLKDPDYWVALDKISGRYLSVFSFHTMPRRRRMRRMPPQGESGVFSYMTGVFSEEFYDGRSLIEKYFDLKNGIKLPAILFFQVSNMSLVDTHLVQLKQEKTEDSFLEIKEIISTAAESVSKVTEDNYKNSEEIFNLIENSLKNRGITLIAKNALNKVKDIKSLLSLFG